MKQKVRLHKIISWLMVIALLIGTFQGSNAVKAANTNYPGGEYKFDDETTDDNREIKFDYDKESSCVKANLSIKVPDALESLNASELFITREDVSIDPEVVTSSAIKTVSEAEINGITISEPASNQAATYQIPVAVSCSALSTINDSTLSLWYIPQVEAEAEPELYCVGDFKISVAQVKVSYDTKGGEFEDNKSHDETYSLGSNVNITSLPTITRDGFEFDGWYLDDSKVESFSNACLCEDVSLIARWIDKQAPTGKITVGNDLSYTDTKDADSIVTKYFSEDVKVEIKGEDNVEVKTVQYFIADSVLNPSDSAITWVDYSKLLTLNAPSKLIVYAKITDTSNNVTYLSTDLICCDNEMPKVDGIEDGHKYWDNVSFSVSAYSEIKSVVASSTSLGANKILTPNAQSKYSISYAAGETVTITVTDKCGNQTIVVIYFAGQHTVTYNGNGATSGTAPTDDNKYKEGVKFGILGNPKADSLVRTGYKFDGWTIEGDSTIYTAGDQYTMKNTNVVFNAHWTPVQYNLQYIYAGGTVATDNPSQYTIESQPFVLTNPTRTYYTFEGWTYEGQTTPEKNVTVGPNRTGDLVFTAHWTRNEHTITYYDNTNTSDSYKEGEKKNLMTPASRSGYLFAGWFTDNNTFANEKTTITSDDNTDVAVYACWIKVSLDTTKRYVPTGKTCELTVELGGSKACQYQWYMGTTKISGATKNSYEPVVSKAGSISYYCTVTCGKSTLSTSKVIVTGYSAKISQKLKKSGLIFGEKQALSSVKISKANKKKVTVDIKTGSLVIKDYCKNVSVVVKPKGSNESVELVVTCAVPTPKVTIKVKKSTSAGVIRKITFSYKNVPNGFKLCVRVKNNNNKALNKFLDKRLASRKGGYITSGKKKMKFTFVIYSVKGGTKSATVTKTVKW